MQESASRRTFHLHKTGLSGSQLGIPGRLATGKAEVEGSELPGARPTGKRESQGRAG